MTAEYRIRRALGVDLAEVLALDRANASQPHWSLADYMATLHCEGAARQAAGGTPRRCLFVAETVEGIVGVAAGRVMAIGRNALEGDVQERDLPGGKVPGGNVLCGNVLGELESVGVADRHRRIGIGRELCQSVIAWCRSQGASVIELEVRSLSEGPIALYRGMGFVETGRRARYYRNPQEDALLMRLSLDRIKIGAEEPGGAGR